MRVCKCVCVCVEGERSGEQGGQGKHCILFVFTFLTALTGGCYPFQGTQTDTHDTLDTHSHTHTHRQ